MRVIAQRVLTGEFLSWDVPLGDGKAVRELSGPGGITGVIEPRDARLIGDDGLPLIEEWSTALYFEDDNGDLPGGGLVTRMEETTDGALKIEAPGFSTYPHGIVHADTHKFALDADALDVYRYLWDYVQSFKDGDLGVTVDGLDSGEKVSSVVTKDIKFKNVQSHMEIIKPKKTAGLKPNDEVTVRFDKAYRLPWWEFRDCGEEMDSMLELATADYIERHSWNGDHTAINHHIDLGVPRLGKKRRDLRFAEGENVVAALPLTIDGDEFAQVVYGVGRGEGRKIRHSRVGQRDHRLRRTALFVDKHAHQKKIDRLTRREFNRRSGTKTFDTVLIRDHENARIGQINPGDDILIEADLDWHGRVRIWSRVLSIETSVIDDTAVLRVKRSDSF